MINISIQLLSVVLPDLSGTLFEAKSSENGDAGVHHVDLVKVLHLDPGPGGPGGAALGVMLGAVPAFLATDGPVAAGALDIGGGGGELLVTTQAHRLGQRSWPDLFLIFLTLFIVRN